MENLATNHWRSLRGNFIGSHFFDPDGDPLVFAAASDTPGVVTVDVMQSTLKLNPVASGTATIEVKATDIFHSSVKSVFTVNVDQTVGISEPVIAGNQIIVAPNPFKEKLTIFYQAIAPGPVYIAIIDIQGKIIWQLDGYQVLQGVNPIEVTINSVMTSGIYSCRLLQSGRASTARVMKH